MCCITAMTFVFVLANLDLETFIHLSALINSLFAMYVI